MDRLYKPSSIRREPLITICWIIGITAVVGGIYVMSPFLVLDSPTGAVAMYHTLGSQVGLLLLGISALVSGGLIIAGILTNKVKIITEGLLLNFVIRMYGQLAAFAVFGLDASWISSITLMLITLVCYFVLRAKG